MTTTRLPRVEQVAPTGRTAEDSVIKSNTVEATRLYQRGVAAARGGQKRVAAGMLTRSVQLDPNNEGAWLWLSGVIDDPHQIAFCLNAVLKLNPANERARKGLRWLEERQLLQGTPKPSALLDITIDETPGTRHVREQSESWWVNWRQLHREMRRVSLLLWSVPLVILSLALIIHQAFALAVTQMPPPPTIPTVAAVPSVVATGGGAPTVAALPTRNPEPTPVPILNAAPVSLRESQVIAYLKQLAPIREQLRDAVESYRNVTGKPGSATIGHAAAAQNLGTSVDKALSLLQQMNPPEELWAAHNDYIQGLQLEREAINAMVEFYGSYQIDRANFAATRFQDANAHFDRARGAFDLELQTIRVRNAVSAYTMR